MERVLRSRDGSSAILKHIRNEKGTQCISSQDLLFLPYHLKFLHGVCVKCIEN
jgi:hypothetical protein